MQSMKKKINHQLNKPTPKQGIPYTSASAGTGGFEGVGPGDPMNLSKLKASLEHQH